MVPRHAEDLLVRQRNAALARRTADRAQRHGAALELGEQAVDIAHGGEPRAKPVSSSTTPGSSKERCTSPRPRIVVQFARAQAQACGVVPVDESLGEARVLVLEVAVAIGLEAHAGEHAGGDVLHVQAVVEALAVGRAAVGHRRGPVAELEQEQVRAGELRARRHRARRARERQRDHAGRPRRGVQRALSAAVESARKSASRRVANDVSPRR
jgi:hypothetical protein